jgi:hypothetical protein
MMHADTPTKVKERPILFSGPMVRAILEGRKTQTRRVVRMHVDCHNDPDLLPTRDLMDLYNEECPDEGVLGITCPYGNPGDRLWVRETWTHTGTGVWSIADARRGPLDGKVIYRATDEEPCKGCWFPSIFMPREFSRITLEVVKMRVEKLQEISISDAIAEGVGDVLKDEKHPLREATVARGVWVGGEEQGEPWATEVDAYAALWESINGESSWDKNPWVWVVEFKRVESGAGGN